MSIWSNEALDGELPPENNDYLRLLLVGLEINLVPLFVATEGPRVQRLALTRYESLKGLSGRLENLVASFTQTFARRRSCLGIFLPAPFCGRHSREQY